MQLIFAVVVPRRRVARTVSDVAESQAPSEFKLRVGVNQTTGRLARLQRLSIASNDSAEIAVQPDEVAERKPSTFTRLVRAHCTADPNHEWVGNFQAGLACARKERVIEFAVLALFELCMGRPVNQANLTESARTYRTEQR
jgi:hypothetical protein